MVRHPEYATVSLAKVYASQGHTKEALAMYRYLLSKSPDNQEVKDAVCDLENMAGPDDAARADALPAAPETDELARLVQSWIQWTLRYKKMMMLKKLDHPS